MPLTKKDSHKKKHRTSPQPVSIAEHHADGPNEHLILTDGRTTLFDCVQRDTRRVTHQQRSSCQKNCVRRAIGTDRLVKNNKRTNEDLSNS